VPGSGEEVLRAEKVGSQVGKPVPHTRLTAKLLALLTVSAVLRAQQDPSFSIGGWNLGPTTTLTDRGVAVFEFQNARVNPVIKAGLESKFSVTVVP
jgi:hypothetical protein